MYKIIIYSIIVYISVLKCVYCSLATGEACTLELKDDGACVLFSQCQSAVRDKENGKHPQLCGFEGIEPIVCCPKSDGLKSKQHCDEYLHRAAIPPPPIVGGVPAEQKEFPHIVALGFGSKRDIKWLCAGSLISDNFVLTAAHCIRTSEFGEVKWARMGTINLEEPENGGSPEDFEIVDRYIHPEYRSPSKYNDIALVKLNQSVLLTEFVQPACINTKFNTNKAAEAIGWGKTSYTGSTSNDLLKVELEIYDKEICMKSYKNIPKRNLPNGILDETQVCAGGRLGESKDTCQGDSGGPLHELLGGGSVNIYNVIGITSFGKACGIANVPGIYTRVSYYVPWIESIIWP
ncbi:hypothetical protein ILUMI_01116 [Ignelater luminosus]|uniref:Peptidase S1 domain-containing protein n=1 Tax=Ignelater luminosus TaxID=2038154 RepID=A0A8K0DKQ3_IGNLU|nr:hypothetical protein ILUMI_01116 [Ignelater luminosus]